MATKHGPGYTIGMDDTSAVPASDPYDINFLDPGRCKLERDPGSARLRLIVEGDRCWLDVRVARTLPLSRPDEYIALRDSKDAEIGIFRTVDGLDAESAVLLRAALDRSYLLARVEKVYSVVEKSGLVVMDVHTDHGRRKLAVRNIRDNSVALSGRRVLVTDADGSRYDFQDIYSISRKASEILQKVL